MATRYRETARVIPVSPQGRALLLCRHDPARADARCWGTIGGGIAPGETAPEAAVRELWEEAGIAALADDLGEPFFRGRHTHRRNSIDVTSLSSFFVLPLLEEREQRPATSDPGDGFVARRWWRPSELTGISLSSPDLPVIITEAVSIAAGRMMTMSLAGHDTSTPCRSLADGADGALHVRLARSVTSDVIEILRPAVGVGSSRQLAARVRQLVEAATTLTGHIGGRMVAAACVELDGTQGRLVAIAVAPGERGRGWGRSLIAAMPALLGVKSLSAETDAEAVGFYRALGFTVVSLGEKYPGVERFACWSNGPRDADETSG